MEVGNAFGGGVVFSEALGVQGEELGYGEEMAMAIAMFNRQLSVVID